jgi:hypothetical protein
VDNGQLLSEVYHLESIVEKQKKQIEQLEKNNPIQQFKKGVILPIHSQWYVKRTNSRANRKIF